jgi:hypothetical protein
MLCACVPPRLLRSLGDRCREVSVLRTATEAALALGAVRQATRDDIVSPKKKSSSHASNITSMYIISVRLLKMMWCLINLLVLLGNGKETWEIMETL